jgi:hypothetical protein
MRYYLPRRTVPLRQEFASGVCLNHIAGRQARPRKKHFRRCADPLLGVQQEENRRRQGSIQQEQMSAAQVFPCGTGRDEWPRTWSRLRFSCGLTGCPKVYVPRSGDVSRYCPSPHMKVVPPRSALGDHDYARLVGHRARSGRSDPPVERQARNVRCPTLFKAHKDSNFVSELGAQFVGWV